VSFFSRVAFVDPVGQGGNSPVMGALPGICRWWLNMGSEAAGGAADEELSDVARISLLAAAVLTLGIAGCASPRPASGQAPPVRAQPVRAQLASLDRVAARPITGVKLSALLTAPRGFTVQSSSDSGDAPVSTLPSPGPQSVSCSSWWAGHGYYGPAEVGYATKQFVSSDHTTLTVLVYLLRRGGGTPMFDDSVLLHNRCARFAYRDDNGLWYQVEIKPASPAGLGDRSLTYDATETRDGEVFPTEVTIIQVGDAFIGFNQTGPAGSPPKRVVPPLARLIRALRAAGY
jgi:hypothetical protein